MRYTRIMQKPRTKHPYLDTLGRRYRHAKPTGTRIFLQPDDILWFKKIQEHGFLSSDEIIAFSSYLGTRRSKDKILRRLKKLCVETRMLLRGKEIKGPLLDKHHKQDSDVLFVNGKFNVFHNRPAAKKLLKTIGIEGFPPDASSSVQHDMYRSFVTAGIELCCLREPDKYRYISHCVVLRRLNLKGWFPIDFNYEIDSHTYKHSGILKPDAIPGIEYLQQQVTVYYCVEADCMNETITTKNMDAKKSHTKSILQYRKLLGGFKWVSLKDENGAIQKEKMRNWMEFFGGQKQVGLMKLTVTKTRVHSSGIQQQERYLSPGGHGMSYSAHTIFAPHSTFDPYYFRPPGVMYHLFDEKWHRSIGKPFQLS